MYIIDPISAVTIAVQNPFLFPSMLADKCIIIADINQLIKNNIITKVIIDIIFILEMFDLI